MARRKSQVDIRNQEMRIRDAIDRRLGENPSSAAHRNFLYRNGLTQREYEASLRARRDRAISASQRYINNINNAQGNIPATASRYERLNAVLQRAGEGFPRSVYMGTTNGAQQNSRGITISQESLDAFRRRRDAAANGFNAG